MVLFPIAFAWLVFVVVWALRQTLEPTDRPWRPWRQRTRGPRSGPHGHRRDGSRPPSRRVAARR